MNRTRLKFMFEALNPSSTPLT